VVPGEPHSRKNAFALVLAGEHVLHENGFIEHEGLKLFCRCPLDIAIVLEV
jgi:hypothetical protein